MLCEQLQQLRLQSGLVDLDIVCEVNANNMHPLLQIILFDGFSIQCCSYWIHGHCRNSMYLAVLENIPKVDFHSEPRSTFFSMDDYLLAPLGALYVIKRRYVPTSNQANYTFTLSLSPKASVSQQLPL